jgi:hypothetical protein
MYPVAITDPLPTCISKLLDPFVLTPLNITVIFFTQLGIPVKSIAVPLVEATEVPDLMMLLGAVMVVVPSAASTMLLLPELGCLRLVVDSVDTYVTS